VNTTDSTEFNRMYDDGYAVYATKARNFTNATLRDTHTRLRQRYALDKGGWITGALVAVGEEVSRRSRKAAR